MSERRGKHALATVLGAVSAMVLGLVTLPAGQAGAAAAACTWQKRVWELPAGADVGTLDGYDGDRWAVGITGNRSWMGGGITDPRGTLWDDGKVALRVSGEIPHLNDVNASGLVVGDTIVGNEFVAITVDHDGTTHRLPGDPAWDNYSADLVSDNGDIVGTATVDRKFRVVVWPAGAPGTYRVLPTPDVAYLHLQDVDDQGRIIAQSDSSVGGLVWDTDGQWRELASNGTPWAVRDGRVVGGLNDTNAAAEWTARGGLVRTIGSGAINATAVGGHGTVGGHRFVNSQRQPVLWRDGVVSDPLTGVPSGFALNWLSDDERTLVGVESRRPVAYDCG
ncbi:hypothetical protein [Streptomyces sp. SudanB182_2057]|uniref:hypothetical protein n=1 Tax=Streptomyces sp. SudanB182_2057 TaxID=3035281 RepID=UPI003F561660